VKVGAADGRAGHPHDRVASLLQSRFWPIFQRFDGVVLLSHAE
jgi:hypothetical protein